MYHPLTSALGGEETISVGSRHQQELLWAGVEGAAYDFVSAPRLLGDESCSSLA